MPASPYPLLTRRAALAALAAATAALSTAPLAHAAAPGRGFLPDDRAYEMVSPVDKNGTDVLPGISFSQAAIGGGAVAYSSFGGFADTKNLVQEGIYLARRGPEGWGTEAISPQQDTGEHQRFAMLAHSSDLAHTVFRAGPTPVTQDAAPGTTNLYARDNATGVFSLLTPTGGPLGDVGSEPGYFGAFAGASADFSHVVFEASRPLTLDAPIDEPDGGGSTNLYDRVGGTLHLVGILPDGTPDPHGAFAGSAGNSHGEAGARLGGATGHIFLRHVVSDDGSHIFWTDPSDGQLYVRINDAVTVHVSASQRTDCAADPTCGGDGHPDPAADPAGPQATRFETATPDGSVVFFTSREQLTDDSVARPGLGEAGEDLYAFNTNTHTLTDVTANAGATSADALGVLGTSDDGQVVYFAARGHIAPGADAVDQSLDYAKYYVWDHGALSYLATGFSAGSDDDDNNWDAYVIGDLTARVSPDGRYLVLRSLMPLDREADDPSGAVRDPAGQIYLVDHRLGTITCVSCAAYGLRDASSDLNLQTTFGWPGASTVSRALLPGGRVVFSTEAALVDDDTNGRSDVYLWEDGAPHLITSGTSPTDSYFADANASGDDIFFTTRERLSKWDTDANMDLYDARVHGGLPEPSAAGTPCSGDDCQGPATGPVAPPAPPSLTLQGPAVPALAPSAAGPTARLTAPKLKTIRGRSVKLTLQASVKGRLSWRGSGVEQAHRTVAQAGSTRITIRLTARARAVLAKRGAFRTTVRIMLKPSAGSSAARTVSLTFKAATKKGR